MTSARGPVQSAGEHADGARARRGAPQTPAAAGALPAGPALAPSAAAVLRLQRAYGNQAVQRLLPGAEGAAAAAARVRPARSGAPGGAGHATQAARSAPAPRSGAARVQRWKDPGHMQTTREAADAALPEVSPFFQRIGMKRDEFIKEVEEASVNMDKIVQHLGDRFMPGSGERGQTTFWGFVGTLAASEMEGKVTGQTRRGIKGEGPDHGEAGYYEDARASAVAGNVAREDHYIQLALQAYRQGQYSAMIDRLGDACHVSADRGSHDEGGQGEGHDTRKPDTSKGESGTNLTLGAGKNYMEGWADNDVVGNNPDGYDWGLQCTVLVLSRFFREVRQLQLVQPLAMNTIGVRPDPREDDKDYL